MIPVRLPDLPATERLAAALAPLLRPGDAILLDGVLGAGKTTLARALIRAACAQPSLDVPSPSYTLVQTYETAQNLALHHFDLWRLDGPDALAELGWDDATLGIVLVEWPDRLQDYKPDNALTITLSLANDDNRFIDVRGWEERLGEQKPAPPNPPALLGRRGAG